MKYQVCILISFLLVLLLTEWVKADLSWKNADSLMNGDLYHRMRRKIPTRRRYCDCSEVDDEEDYPICASNGALYENACLFKCAQVRWPSLAEVDIAGCGSQTFKEFKLSEFRPHY